MREIPIVPHSQGAAYDTIKVNVPDELKPYTTASGLIAVDVDGMQYTLDEALYSRADKPYLRFYDKNRCIHVIALPIVTD